MVQKLGFFNQWMFGEWADRQAINFNADELMTVENNLGNLQARVVRQGQELMRLRAMIMGLVEVMHAKAPFDDAELERATKSAWDQLQPPPGPPVPDDPWKQAPAPAAASTDPYRGTPAPVRTTTCAKCGRTVPASQTTITERGEVCDTCA